MTISIENLRELRHEFHRFPELGFQEKQTKIKIAKFLRAKGLEVVEGVEPGLVLVAHHTVETHLPVAQLHDFPVGEQAG